MGGFWRKVVHGKGSIKPPANLHWKWKTERRIARCVELFAVSNKCLGHKKCRRDSVKTNDETPKGYNKTRYRSARAFFDLQCMRWSKQNIHALLFSLLQALPTP